MRNLTDDQFAIYRMGADDALKFKSGSHLLNQDVFKAETAEYRLWVGYDDVTGIYFLDVTFKDRVRNGEVVHVSLEFSNTREALERAFRFVTEHPAPRPYCDVDY